MCMSERCGLQVEASGSWKRGKYLQNETLLKHDFDGDGELQISIVLSRNCISFRLFFGVVKIIQIF